MSLLVVAASVGLHKGGRLPKAKIRENNELGLL